MSESESPERIARRQREEVTVEDIQQLTGASTPHFALQIRNRIVRLISDLPPEHPARRAGEREIARLVELGLVGEYRGEAGQGEPSLPSLQA